MCPCVDEIVMRRGLFLAPSQSSSTGVNNKLLMQTCSLLTTLSLCLSLTWPLLWGSTFSDRWDHPDHWLSLSTPSVPSSLSPPHLAARPFLPVVSCQLLSRLSLSVCLPLRPSFRTFPLSDASRSLCPLTLLFRPLSISVWCYHFTVSNLLSCLSFISLRHTVFPSKSLHLFLPPLFLISFPLISNQSIVFFWFADIDIILETVFLSFSVVLRMFLLFFLLVTR